MCEVRKYSDIPGKEAKDQTWEKCSGMENISNLGKVLLWYLLSYRFRSCSVLQKWLIFS